MILSRRDMVVAPMAMLALGMTAPLASPLTLAARNRGVILVGASWCGLCHQAAPLLHQAAQQWGWTVLLASADNRPIAPFESFLPTANHPATAIIARFPTTIIAEPALDQVIDAFEGYEGPRRYLARIARAMNGEVAQ